MSTRPFKVIVTVYNAKSIDSAISQVSHMLNGSYPPGEIVFPVNALKTNKQTGAERLARLKLKEELPHA